MNASERRVWRAVVYAVTAVFLAAAQLPAQEKPLSGYEAWNSQRQEVAANPDVIAWYDFQAGQGTVLADGAGAGGKLDGTIKGAAWTEGRWPGKKALKFNGKSDYVEIPSAPSLFPLGTGGQANAGELSIELWLKVAAYHECGLVDKGSGGNGPEGPYMVWLGPNGLQGIVGDGAKCTVVSDSTGLEADKWTHVVLTVKAGAVKLYRDGMLAAQTNKAVTPADNGKPLRIGWMGAGKFFFDGAIDEVILYRKVLDNKTIQSHAARFAPTAPLPPELPLKMLAPNGGEEWAVGSKQVLRWEGGRAGPVKVEYSSDGGANWKQIGTAAAKVGRFVWTVAGPVSKECKVKISDASQSVESKAPISVVASQAAGYKWVNVTMNGPFAPRDGCGALVFQERMWLLGGWNPNDKTHFPRICNNEVWSSQNGSDWVLVKPNTFLDATFNDASDWTGRHCAGCVVYKDKMWIIGADGIRGRYESDVWNSSDGKTWTRVTDRAAWGPRLLHHTLVFQDKIWLMGGQTLPQHAPAEERFYRDIWISVDGAKWDKVEPREPYWSPRGMIGGSVVFKDRMWILGGGTYDTPQHPKRLMYNDVWSSADGVNWQCHTAEAPWAPREYHDVAVFDGRMWVLEGADKVNRNDVWYSADGVNWYEVPGTPWTPRHAASVMVFDNALWVILGNNMEPDVWKLVSTNASR